MWLRVSTCTFALLLCFTASSADSPEGAVVYPRFLEGRTSSGEKVLKISDDLTLTLEQQPAFGERLLIRTLSNGGIDTYQYVSGADYNKYLFQDRKNLASLAVTNEDGLRVHGVIGDEMRIKPLATVERTSEGHLPHLLYREDSLQIQARESGYTVGTTAPGDGAGTRIPHDDYLSVPLNGTGADTSPSYILSNATNNPEQSNNSPIPHNDYVSVPIGTNGTATLNGSLPGNIEQRSDDAISPEVHIVVDSTYFKGFGRNTKAVILYLGTALNSMNLRYETVSYPKITLKIVGFTFNGGPRDEPYITTFPGFDEYLDSSSTLQYFNMYYKHDPVYQDADVMMLVTGRDMASLDEKTIEPGTVGLAYLGGACTNVRTGLCEDTPLSYSIVRVMAHELGHSLGCVHDGDGPDRNIPGHPGARSCPWSDGYIMSYVQENNNEFVFSSCCAKQIQFMYKHHTHWCLHSNNTKKEIVPPRIFPGSKVTLDELCRTTYANTGYTLFHDTSRNLPSCRVPCRSEAITIGNRMQYKVAETKALDGYPCDKNDKKKVCIRGECVHDKRYTGNGGSGDTPASTTSPTRQITPRQTTRRPTTRRPTTKRPTTRPWYRRWGDLWG